MRDITTVALADLIPDSIRDDPVVSAAVTAIDTELNAVSQLCMVPALYARIDELDGATLDHMAWQLNSKIWRDSWPVAVKRAVIRTVILEKSKKGTRQALEQAVQSLGSAIIITEWWEQSPPGVPHTFELVFTISNVTGQSTAEAQEDLLRRIDDVKPTRSHYNFIVAQQGVGSVGLAGAIRPAVYKRLGLNEAPYMGGIGIAGAIRPVIYLRLSTEEV